MKRPKISIKNIVDNKKVKNSINSKKLNNDPIICTRRIEFDSAHRIINHESKCKMLHGHRYALEISFVGKDNQCYLDNLGRVIDFGEIKNIIKSWIDEFLDHNTILSLQDKKFGDLISKITGQKIYYLKNSPTAENIASHLFYEIIPKLISDSNVRCCRIKLYETPNCYVEINNNIFQS
jgi:6-pyruvoyltetrahydropterin/6-carboxytetrahydropterin synthase